MYMFLTTSLFCFVLIGLQSISKIAIPKSFFGLFGRYFTRGGDLFDITVRPSSIRPSLYLSSFVENIARTNQYSGTNVNFLAQGNNDSLSLFQFVRYLIGTFASKVSTNTRLMRIRGHSELVMSLWRINTVSKR